MRATYRRERKTDPLASEEAVRSLIEQLRSTLPEIIPKRDKDLVKMLRAVRHINRYRATDTKRGRPSRWKREELLSVGSRLSSILERETSSHISLSSFVDHYLRLLNFPSDVVEALSVGDINLFEAEQLARITPERLNVSPTQAKRVRTGMLSTHLQARLSGERLRQRVAELLRVSSNEAGDSSENSQEMNLEDFDPYDPTHLFWDQIKQLGFALRDIRREDVMDEEIDELLQASEPVMTILARIQRRKERGVVKKLVI
ncbi:MAG: hypothetical protein WBP93_05065 [Pyrinomonadaceae bacterium]